jgi:TolB-like protein/class 3 adenylate cyclase/Flp pilus assembly protein TadD
LTAERVERRLAAVLAADVAGYSRLMGGDEEGTLARLKAVRKALVDPTIAAHRGRIVKTTGDGMLVEFASAVDAVRGAVEVQRGMTEQNASVPQEQRIEFRIGIHVGDIIIDDNDIFGDGVNVAARVENVCEPGGVCVSGNAFEQIRGKINFTFDDLGEKKLKNIERPVRLYAVRDVPSIAPRTTTTISPSDNSRPLPLPDKPSIAVLPFQNMSGDPEQEYFADGMVEEIITALSRFKYLFVIARNSSFTYKGRAVDIKQVGLELGVRYVLEGSVRKAGGRVRITGQLIEADTGMHLWADKFEGSLDDVFELQDQITSSVVGIVVPKIQLSEFGRATRKPTHNLEAYDWCLRAEAEFAKWTREGSGKTIRMCQKALELDPDYAVAMAMIAGTQVARWQQQWMVDQNKEIADALRYARSALEIDKNDAEVLARCALTIGYFAADLETANSLADRAISLNENQHYGWFTSGWIKLWLGDHQQANAHFSRAMKLNPFDELNFIVKNGMALAYLLSGDYTEAQTCIQKALVDNPKYIPALRVSASIEAALGHFERGRLIVGQILEFDPSHRISTAMVVRLSRKSEDRAKLAEYLRLVGMPE